jgi:xanthine dehydrogenase small subunit
MLRISFYLNRDLITADVSSELSALQFLRDVRGLTGTKEACNEGDCGACTIAVGQIHDSRVKYRAINSCLLPAAKLHGRHIVTVEGLAEGDVLHPVQQAMVDYHAVQCGYCTPGVVMSLFCLFLENPQPDRDALNEALDGTLCRCTGYAAISKAAMAIADAVASRTLTKSQLCPDYFADIEKQLHAFTASPLQTATGDDPIYLMPSSLAELFDRTDQIHHIKQYSLVNGSTDVTVDVRFKHRRYSGFLDLSRIAELDSLKKTKDQLIIGANVTLTDLLADETVTTHFPALHQALGQMCSRQIRNVATLAGNICCASPIGDSIPPLLIYNAVVVLQSRHGERRVPLGEFFVSYRKTVMQEREIVAALELPLSRDWSRFEKTGKRRALDIASVNSAIRVAQDHGRISGVQLAFGGVSAVPFIAQKTCRYLLGKALSESVIHEAANMAAGEIDPISDVRGSAEFRRMLTRNHVIKHLTCLQEERP